MASPFRPSLEQDMLRSLASLVTDVFEQGDRDATRRMPQIGYRIALEASQRNSETLMKQATDLWLAELGLLPQISDTALRQRVSDLIAEMAYYVVTSLASRLQDEYMPLAGRLAPVDLLKLLARFQTRVLKVHVDRRDSKAFEDAWRRWTESWFRGWHPEQDVTELVDQLAQITDPAKAKPIAAQLEQARKLVEVRDDLEQVRSHDTLQLGAWVAYSYKRGRLERGEFAAFAPYLVDGFTSPESIRQELLLMTDVDWDGSLLMNWETATWDTRQTTSGYIPDRAAAQLWLTLLLVRALSPGEEQRHDEAGLPEWTADAVHTELEEIRSDWTKWSEFLESEEAVDRAARWLAGQRERGVQARRERLATAQLDTERVGDFVQTQVDTFTRETLVRQRAISLGLLTVMPLADPDQGLRRAIVPKEPFVSDGPLLIGDRDLGRDLARLEEESLYEALEAIATPRPADPSSADAALAAIADLRSAGFEPDVILVPANVWVRPALARHRRFKWRRASLIPEPGPMGYLDDVPIYDVGPHDSNQLIVTDLSHSLRIVDRRPAEQRVTPHVAVLRISEERAAELVEDGLRFSDQPNWSDEETARYLVQFSVEIESRLAYEFSHPSEAPDATRRVDVPVEREG